ncbi:helix-turn-helix transcriptional regulator [Streptococcus suis]|uniref:helix-turn-helix domain-containing protein n=1 Tax=Streptococcus suis TaxID=1307 RepID=UPI0005CEA225|nr:helix-turn-helix domain-containing protein [Streptococcus suis]NQP41824.1 helix-turn-helix transcriptional regulator [Streptococcus suis]NQP43916.1 helix-turn-helix transcriptional regulator [Streptococcus suis]CYU84671.1 transcriptional regulator [Streptococcus suis]
MSVQLGSRLKQKRKEMKLSQKELAEGVCKQGQISRIESGAYTPGSELLFELSKKLNVSMNYFFEDTVSEQEEELVEFKTVVRNFLVHRDYQGLRYVYELEYNNKHRLSVANQLYLEWIGGLVDFYFYDKKKEAKSKMEYLLEKLESSNLFFLQVSNTLLNFYFDVNDEELFDVQFERLIEKTDNFQPITIEELELKIKLQYNISRYLWLKKDYIQAIASITKAIEFCRSHRSYYSLPDLFCLLGNVHEELGNTESAKQHFRQAYFLYKLDANRQMELNLERYIEEDKI